MQKFHIGSCNSAVNSSAIGGLQPRDSSRAESPAVSPNYSLNSRRSSPPRPYRLRCDKEHLNSRLGPPDFHPQNPNCLEETLTREFVQLGYRETVEGLEESRETSLSQALNFTKPVIFKCKEAIRKCHKAINESRARKRKVGQVYGVPLSGTLLTKSSVFPEQRPCGEDFKKKWIEGLSQPHKRLRSLADHVPHGYRRKSLLEVLIRNNVPLSRATWFVKVIYLNQVRAASNSSSGFQFHDKTPLSRSEQWTKDIIEYLQYLLDEFCMRSTSHSSSNIQDRSSQVAYTGSMHQKGDSVSALMVGNGPSLYTKWWYVVRIIHWHHAEGLVIPSLIIEWILNQLQEKQLHGVLQLLLPIIYGFIEAIVLSQTYVRSLVGISIRYIREPSPGVSNLVDNSRHAYMTSAVVEMLRYLIRAVPDTFVALDCFPLPTVVNPVVNDGSFLSKMLDDARKVKGRQIKVSGVFQKKSHDVQTGSFRTVVSSIRKRAAILSKAARSSPGHNIAKALRVLDQAVMSGDIGSAYNLLFENVLDGACGERWIADVSPSLYTSLEHIGTVKSYVICSIFCICEWATCEYRDFRTLPPHGMKFTGRKDLSQIFIAVRLLKLKLSSKTKLRTSRRKIDDISDTFDSPGPLHDVIVCWVDQHEVHNGDGFRRLQLLIRELIQAGIFSPRAYVRQLIVSGIMDSNVPTVNVERRKRHYKLLKQLPAHYIDALGQAQISLPPMLEETMHVYSTERQMVLPGLQQSGQRRPNPDAKSLSKKQKLHHGFSEILSGISPSSIDKVFPAVAPTRCGTDVKLDDLKASISALLNLPHSSSFKYGGDGFDESQWSVKGTGGVNNRTDSEEASGCEDCRRAKRQKVNEECGLFLQPYLADEEETWWVRKGVKYTESSIAEPPIKPSKQALRGRPKSVRKTQSLAQLAAAARIEGSHGASTSHLCENNIGCPHHRTSLYEISRSVDGAIKQPPGDIQLIGKLLKQMRFVEKRAVTSWLTSAVKQLVEEADKFASKVGQYGNRPLAPPVDDKSSSRWRLGEEELSTILYIMDTCDDVASAARFLLWLLPKVPSTHVSISRNLNAVMLPRNTENHACKIGEAFLLSSIRRYENIIAAVDLLSETLSAAISCASTIMASNGRLSGSLSLVYARHLLNKYGSVDSVLKWKKTFKSTADKRLISELESGRSSEGDFRSLGIPNGMNNLDDYIRQKIRGVRQSRTGLNMKEIVYRHMDELFQYFTGKDKKSFGLEPMSVEKWDDCYPMANKIVTGLMDCMRQTGGAAQESDPSLVSSAIAAVINSAGLVIARFPDLIVSTNHSNSPQLSGPLYFARRILRVHIVCLSMLKDALGEHQSHVFDVSLATEASSALSQAFAPVKTAHSQFQMSPESPDCNANEPSSKPINGRAIKTSAAVSAVIVGAILQGVVSLERMVYLFRLKESLDLIQFVKNLTDMNVNARSVGVLKVDNLIEVSVNWFRVLVGNCRTVCDGLIVELLGEASIVALSRMQRMLSLSLVFPPAYSIFSFVIWRPILDATIGIREDLQQLYQSLAVSVDEAIRHHPFREICLRDTHGIYDLIAADNLDFELFTWLDKNCSNINLKASPFVSIRSRLFFDFLVTCKMPETVSKTDGKNWLSSPSELKRQCGENVKKIMGKLVHILDTLQPARFHWQWLELRLLLNEQAVNDKMHHEGSLAEAVRFLSPSHDKTSASDNEGNFIQIILTRLLVRPDAAPLFSEVVRLLGKSLEDSMLTQAKWLLGGFEVLYGKKSIRQKVVNIATELKGLSLKSAYWKPWGWCHSDSNASARGDNTKSEASAALEEGEFVDEGTYFNRSGKGTGVLDMEGFIVSQQHVTERALVELILPCVDQGSNDFRWTFANEMVRQIKGIEQHINAITSGVGKPTVNAIPATGSPASKNSNRKSGKGNSPGLSRQSLSGSSDTVPSSPVALRASLSLRLQFLLRLLPIVCADREPLHKKMRYGLASVILRLLGSRVVFEDSCHFVNPALMSSKRDVQSLMESSAAALLNGESLFDCLLLVLHLLLSCYKPSWLKPTSESGTTDQSKDFPAFDREVLESLQNDLNRRELPDTIRFRIQSAMPILSPSNCYTVSCQLPTLSPTALISLQSINQVTSLNPSNSSPSQKNSPLPSRTTTSAKNKAQTLLQENQMEIDQWTLLEDGTGSSQPASNSTGVNVVDNSNLKAAFWLKGAVRVRRTDLTYIGAVDEDS